MKTPWNDYEERARQEIDRYKNAPPSTLSRWSSTVSGPFERLASAAFATTPGKVALQAAQNVVTSLNDAAAWSVSDDYIYKTFREAGHKTVHSGEGILQLSLEKVDGMMGDVSTKYITAGALQGAGTGMFGGVAIAADVPVLVSFALRAVNEYALWYGFDVSTQAERTYAVRVLSVASSPVGSTRQIALAELTRVSVLLGQKKSWEELQKLLGVKMLSTLAEAIGLRIAKAKLAQVVPLLGGAVGGSFNGWYLRQVTEASSNLYRERFLIEKYGPEAAVPVRGLPFEE